MASETRSPLADLLATRIREHGPMTFVEFMEAALYHPDHGYYLHNDPTLDYQSSSNVHPVFGAAIARQLADMWELLGRPARFDVFEAGAGNCRLAADILFALRSHYPDAYATTRYVVQDVSLVVDGASATLAAAGLPSDAVSIVRELPRAATINGCILSNELLDAFPVHRVRVRNGIVRELRVGLEGRAFADVESPARPEIEAYFGSLGLLPGEDCEAEVNLRAPSWMTRAATALRRGYILTLDYGYEAPELYAPWRKRGTLLTFYRQTSGDDPYRRVGQQDITASVDFTKVRQAGEEADFQTFGLTTQTDFLAALGIGEALAQKPEADQIEAYYALRRSVIELTDPTGLGRIRVLLQGRDVPDGTPMGFVTSG